MSGEQQDAGRFVEGVGNQNIAEFLSNAPCLVAGDCAYAKALAFVLGTPMVRLTQLEVGILPGRRDRRPMLLGALKWVFLVLPEALPVPSALHYHRQIWEIVERLSPKGLDHELAFLFILPPSASSDYEDRLARGIVVGELDPGKTGHAAWRRCGSLTELLSTAAKTVPQHPIRMRRRQKSDPMRRAVDQFRIALPKADVASAKGLVEALVSAFRGQEFWLDLFCRQPMHDNGSRLRKWLQNFDPTGITHDEWVSQQIEVVSWLMPESLEVK